jgi:N-terminal acetyltransferase B complex non-catalytic subunit
LCKAEPPATDLDTLDILYQTLKKMGDQDETIRTLWEKASKAKPQELELQMRWFTHAFEGDDWKSAQKVRSLLRAILEIHPG